MAVYKPTYRDKKTGETRESGVWWFEFTYAGRRVRESAKTSRKTVALEAEKNRRRELERALAGMPVEPRENRIKSVADVVKVYQEHYPHNHRAKSVIFSKQRLAHVVRLLGSTLLPDLTEEAIHGYIKTRLKEKASGRTINMELGELSRAVGKTWRELWPRVRKLEERSDVGKALSPDQESRLLEAATGERRRMISLFVRIALSTGMRSGEITALTWGQVDFERRTITVGHAKTRAGTGREIPIGPDLCNLLQAHASWCAERFGVLQPGWYLFPFGKPRPEDPTRPTTTMKNSWATLRKAAGVDCRLHDLRHTAATKMAEAGVPESTMLALMGHMSRAMLERYSHIRMKAKREAVESLELHEKRPISNGVPKVSPKVAGSKLVQ